MEVENLDEFTRAFGAIGFEVVARHASEDFGELAYELERPPTHLRLSLDQRHVVTVQMRLAAEEWWSPPQVYSSLNGLDEVPLMSSVDDYVSTVSAVLEQTGGVFPADFVAQLKRDAQERGHRTATEIHARAARRSSADAPEWQVALDETTDAEVHGTVRDRLRKWRDTEDPHARLSDQDIRVDTFHTASGDRLRISVRRPTEDSSGLG